MSAKLLKDTIRDLSRTHLLENNGVLAGQCLTAVGWVGGTVPELSTDDGLIELSMADVAGGGIVCGFALAGRRPIYVVRYQGFLWYNLVTIANYCAKSNFLWRRPCPMWVRAICMEGSIGPVAGNGHHSMATRMPDLTVIAPATADEYTHFFERFTAQDDVYLVSEHRRLFTNTVDLSHQVSEDSSICILAISATRIDAVLALQKVKSEYNKAIDYYGITELAPLKFPESFLTHLSKYKHVIIMDVDYQFSSISTQIELEILKANSTITTHNLSLENKTAGFSQVTDLRTPSADEIASYILNISR